MQLLFEASSAQIHLQIVYHHLSTGAYCLLSFSLYQNYYSAK